MKDLYTQKQIDQVRYELESALDLSKLSQLEIDSLILSHLRSNKE